MSQTDDELRNECRWLLSVHLLPMNLGAKVEPNDQRIDRLMVLCKRVQAQGMENAAILCETMPMSTAHNLAVAIRYVTAKEREG